MKTGYELEREILNSIQLPYFCRWLGEVWSSRGLDVVCEMLEKPYNWGTEWTLYLELVESTGNCVPEICEISEISA